MARLPKKLFEHYMYSPYALPVCRDFLENMGCGSDCLLAHPPRRVRVFHPRFFSEEFPAGIVICCKNFVHYGDCSCRHMLPSAKSAMVLDLFFHPPRHVCDYIKTQAATSPPMVDLDGSEEPEIEDVTPPESGAREDASGESEDGCGPEAAPSADDAHFGRGKATDEEFPAPADRSPPPRANTPLTRAMMKIKPTTPIPIRPPGVLPTAPAAAAAAAAAAVSLGLNGSSPALLPAIRALDERAFVSLSNPFMNPLLGFSNTLCAGLTSGAFSSGGQ